MKKKLALVLSVVSIAFAVSTTGSQSTLKVAVCKPGQAPYAITVGNGTLAGFDVGTFLA